MSIMQERYEIGNAYEQEHARTKTLADAAMRRILRATPEGEAYIFDRLAQRGAIECMTYRVTMRQDRHGEPYAQYTIVRTQRRPLEDTMQGR